TDLRLGPGHELRPAAVGVGQVGRQDDALAADLLDPTAGVLQALDGARRDGDPGTLGREPDRDRRSRSALAGAGHQGDLPFACSIRHHTEPFKVVRPLCTMTITTLFSGT